MECGIDKLIYELLEQKKRKSKGSIYHWSQITFAYNSNKIEGSRLTEDQTEQIFETNNVFTNEKDNLIYLDDMLEVKNHFRLFDFVLDTLDTKLTKEYIIEMNKILKRGTSYEDDPRYNVGGFKTHPNIIGVFNVIQTSKPEDVEKDIDKLLEYYNSLKNVTLNDIVQFHVQFERIHPFGDGNGRVGRMIMFKQCLENKILPFIILDRDKAYYIRGLREWENDQNYLLDTVLTQQDIYDNVCQQLEIFTYEVEEKIEQDEGYSI